MGFKVHIFYDYLLFFCLFFSFSGFEIKLLRFRKYDFFFFQGNELGLTGKMKRSAILEKHAACIGTMFLHKSEHTYNSKCEATAAALEDVQTHLTHQNLSLVNISFFPP